uniref:Variant surface glycoprotein 1125.2916 n=1 Tax=Trypanosoma brucei TaxID=5691 RepID=A0A1J0R931_9TRYP|nr:variant surface glycoprotein 1125.2916 [Trypanosoma brucei]
MGKCTEKPRTTDQIRQAGAELNQMENIPYSPAAQILGYRLAVTIQSKSTPTGSTELTNKQGCGNDNTAGSNGKGITGINHEAHTATPGKQPLKSNGGCKKPNTTEMDDSFNRTKLAYAICQASTVAVPNTVDVATQKVADLTSDSVAQHVTLTLLKKSATTTEDGRDKAVTELLGPKDTRIQAKVFTPLTNVDTSLKFGAEGAPISIEAASSEGNFGKALALFIATAKQPALLGSKEGQTVDNNEEADKADKTEEKKDWHNKAATECVATEEKDCDKTKCNWNKEKSE